MFWEDPLLVGGYQWSVNNNGGAPNPTYSQVIATSLSLVDGPFFAATTQYQGTGVIARPRFAPYAPILSNVPAGSPPNTYTSSFATSDIENAINELIGSGALPQPSSIFDPTDRYGEQDNTIYTVFLPAGANNTGAFCNTAGGCNFSCSYQGAPYTCAYIVGASGYDATFAHEMVEGISGYEHIVVTGCVYNTPTPFPPNQIADICCNNEEQGATGAPLAGNYTVTSYYSVKDGACVIPESWQNFYINEDLNGAGGGWSLAPVTVPPSASSTQLRQISGGSGGVVATGTDDNVYFYSQSSGDWLGWRPYFCIQGQPCWVAGSFGGPGAQFAAGGGIVAGITLDALGVNTYALSQGATGSWTALGTPANGPVTGVTVTSGGVVVVTDVHAQPWYNWRSPLGLVEA